MEITNEFISSGIRNAKNNTWGNRYHLSTPSIKKKDSYILLADGEYNTRINSFDEIILTIILKFLFCPVWLIKKFYSYDNIAGFDDPEQKIEEWINLGLIWKEASVTGCYVRPTYSLFTLFGQDPLEYKPIPFNMLTHTICEEDVMFDVMSGRSQIFKENKSILLPRISELGFDEDNTGTNIIIESDFRNPLLFKPEGIKELNDVENRINDGIKNKAQVTPELTDFRYFTSVKKINSTGIVRKDYAFHIPDLIIPALRKQGKPMSIAIEVELSNKRAIKYEETMNRYKDNNKYGTVYWLCNTPNIANALRDAYKETGGTGATKMKLIEYIIPENEM